MFIFPVQEHEAATNLHSDDTRWCMKKCPSTNEKCDDKKIMSVINKVPMMEKNISFNHVTTDWNYHDNKNQRSQESKNHSPRIQIYIFLYFNNIILFATWEDNYLVFKEWIFSITRWNWWVVSMNFCFLFRRNFKTLVGAEGS